MQALAVLSACLLFAGLARLLGAFDGPAIEKDENGPMFQLNFGLLGVRVLGPTVARVSIGPFQPRSYTISEGTGPMDIILGDNQFVDITVSGLDAANRAGKFANPPVWSIVDPTVATIAPAADGLTCRVEAAVPPVLGSTVLTITDADDPNVPPLSFNVTVQAEPVTHLSVTIGAPQERLPVDPAAPPAA